MASNPDEFPSYDGITFDSFQQWLTTFNHYLDKVAAAKFGIHASTVAANQKALLEVAERVEKQRIYCHVFHHREMGELNEMAVVCYWLLKLQPFYAVDNKKVNYALNAKIALCIFVHVLQFYAKKTGGHITLNRGDRLDNLYYAFRYRNIGRAAMMHLAELCVS